MGLDTYAERVQGALTREDRSVCEALDLKLCEWIGDGSFHGKVHDEVASAVTGVSLYQEWIAPDEVLSLARALDAHSAEDLARLWDGLGVPSGPTHSSQETTELKRFFRVCADRGLGLIGWW